MHRVVADYTAVDSSNTNIRVYVRARPPEDKNASSDFLEYDPENERKIVIRDPEQSNRKYGEVSFQFDRVFWTNTKQEEVFDTICKSQVEHVLSGYNSCCFAYGQTGSGKTYTMFGEEGDIRGIIPRSVEYLFKSLAKRSSTCEVAMVCSFLEIYNDQIRDLGKAYLVAMGVETSDSSALFEKTSDIFESLAGKRNNPYFAPAFSKNKELAEKRPGLKEVMDEYNAMNFEIREDNEGNVFVKDLSLVPVNTIDEVMSLINSGLKVRATHETKMNANSSRSHTVFTMTVLQRDKISGEAIQGMLNLVDLAGSERLKKSESQGPRLKEALHINTSLTALGKVIMALDPASEMSHIPYRDSKLTRVLQNSLGGNSFTTVVAAIHPHPSHYEECLSTLQFANRCRNVRNNPRVNYVGDTEDKDRRIRRLMEEITTLRTRLAQLEGGGISNGGVLVNSASGVLGTNGVNKLIVSVLKKLGIQANVDANGAVVCNGVTVTASEIGDLVGEQSVISNEDNINVNENGGTARSRGATGTGYASSMKRGGGNTEKLRQTISELQESNASLTAKSKERKAVMDEQGKQIQELSNELVKYQTNAKHKDFEYRSLMEEKERALNEQRKALESKHRSEINALLQNNTTLISTQQDAIQKVPETFKQYTALVKRAEGTRVLHETPLRQEFENHLQAIDRSRMSELEHVHAQYAYWLKEKEDNLVEFTKKFNSFRTKKAEQLRMCEKEIVRLYNYTEQLEEILDRVERGEFKMKQNQGGQSRSTTGVLLFHKHVTEGTVVPPIPTINDNNNNNNVTNNNNSNNVIKSKSGAVSGTNVTSDTDMGGLVFPKGLRPVNPLHRPTNDLELTKRIVEKHRERQMKLQRVKEEAFQKSLHHATRISSIAGIGPVDIVVQKQISDLLIPPSTAKGHHHSSRPKTAGSAHVHGNSSSSNNHNHNNSSSNNNNNLGNTVTFAANLNNSNNNNSNSNTKVSRSPNAMEGQGTMNGYITNAKMSLPPHPMQESNFSQKTTINNNINRPQTSVAHHSPFREETSGFDDALFDQGSPGYRPSSEFKRLQEELRQLREEKRLENVAVERLAQEVASQEAVLYIRHLEDETERLRKQVQEINAQLLQARTAQASLSRQLDKVNTK